MSGDGGLIIDDDWKQQAQKEREELSDKLDHAADPAQQMPEASLAAHIESLAVQAMMMMGLAEHPAMPGKRIFDPVQARYLIDVLAMLRDKTKGNVTKEEETYLERLIPELQMIFVEVADAVARQQGGMAAPAAAPTVASGPGMGGAAGLVNPK